MNFVVEGRGAYRDFPRNKAFFSFVLQCKKQTEKKRKKKMIMRAILMAKTKRRTR
jgi:hypothetical protein